MTWEFREKDREFHLRLQGEPHDGNVVGTIQVDEKISEVVAANKVLQHNIVTAFLVARKGGHLSRSARDPEMQKLLKLAFAAGQVQPV